MFTNKHGKGDLNDHFMSTILFTFFGQTKKNIHMIDKHYKESGYIFNLDLPAILYQPFVSYLTNSGLVNREKRRKQNKPFETHLPYSIYHHMLSSDF